MTKLVKFFPTTQEVQDIVLWVDDVEESIKLQGMEEALEEIMDRVFVGDLRCPGYIHVIDDNKELAMNMATLLDTKYVKEMEIMNTVKAGANNETTNTKGAVVKMPSKKLNLKSAVKAAVESQEEIIAAVSETAIKTEEESTVSETKSRRRLPAGANNEVKEENEVKGSKKEDVKVVGRRRLSSTDKKEVKEVSEDRSAGNRKKIGTTKSIKGEYKKFNGPWYLNAGLYPVIERFEQILDNAINGEYVDEELGIKQFVFVDPEDTRQYKDNLEVLLVVQIEANGNILEFPIKSKKGTNSNSDLTSSSIGWIDTKNGLRPAFGQWVQNDHAVEVKCECGHEFHAHPSHIHCEKCDSLYDVIDMSTYKNFIRGNFTDAKKFQVKKVFKFHAPSNVKVPRDTLALVMAMAQNELDLDMYGVIEE